MKLPDGSLIKAEIPCPTPVTENRKHAGGADRPDLLSQYRSAQHRWPCRCWHLFYYFLEVAIRNSSIIHRELCALQQTKPMTHRAFRGADCWAFKHASPHTSCSGTCRSSSCACHWYQRNSWTVVFACPCSWRGTVWQFWSLFSPFSYLSPSCIWSK